MLRISSTTAVTKTKTEWAELLDTTKLIVNFDKKIPDPAVKFNFELDTFQKMVLKLIREVICCIFFVYINFLFIFRLS